MSTDHNPFRGREKPYVLAFLTDEERDENDNLRFIGIQVETAARRFVEWFGEGHNPHMVVTEGGAAVLREGLFKEIRLDAKNIQIV